MEFERGGGGTWSKRSILLYALAPPIVPEKARVRKRGWIVGRPIG